MAQEPHTHTHTLTPESVAQSPRAAPPSSQSKGQKGKDWRSVLDPHLCALSCGKPCAQGAGCHQPGSSGQGACGGWAEGSALAPCVHPCPTGAISRTGQATLILTVLDPQGSMSDKSMLHLFTHLKVLIAAGPASRSMPFSLPRMPVFPIFSPPVSVRKVPFPNLHFPLFLAQGPNAGPAFAGHPQPLRM